MPSSAARLAVVAVAVLLAGCGGGGGTVTDTATETPTVTGTGTPTTTSETPTTAATTTTLQDVDVDPATVKRDVLEAMSAVETYRLAADIERVQSANGVTRTVTVESTGVFDRTARELRTEQTTRAAGRTVNTTTYVRNGTLYQRSPALLGAYSSEWVSVDLANASQQWGLLDTMTRQRAVLTNASVTVRGATTVEDRRAYVLALDVEEAAYNRIVESRLEGAATNVSVNVTDVSFEYVVAADSGRLLRSTGTVNSTVRSRGQEVRVSERVSLQFDGYGDPVNVSLPEAADTAVDLANRTAAG